MLPCSAPSCSACTMEHTACNVFDAPSNRYTCNWRMVECTNNRVSHVMLGGCRALVMLKAMSSGMAEGICAGRAGRC